MPLYTQRERKDLKENRECSSLEEGSADRL